MLDTKAQPNPYIKYDFTGLNFFVGIDPQPSLIACHASSDEEDNVLWFERVLKKKVSSGFKNAEEWELYLAHEINSFVDGVDKSIKSRLDYQPGVSQINAGVEQQRGRVNSIIEAMIVNAGTKVGWNMCVPHPNTWKKSVGLKCDTGNKSNKTASELLVGAELKEYYEGRGLKLPTRIHDLCDAKCISEHVYKIKS